MKNHIPILVVFMISNHLWASKLKEIKWQELSKEDDITTYQPQSFEHSSGLIPIKFKAILRHSVLKVLSVLADDKSKTQWVPNLVSAQELERKSIADVTVYYHYSSPWPFSDRDFIIHNSGSYNPKTQTISVDLKSVKHKLDPAKGDTVRGFAYDGYTTIAPIGNDKTVLEMAFLNDYAGYIPTFLVNYVQKKMATQIHASSS